MNIREIEKRFDQCAPHYERHAALEQEVNDRLVERASFVRRQPGTIVDLGCGTGRASRALGARFSEADIICLDISRNMLVETRKADGGGLVMFEVQADLTHLPMAARSADLVYSNLALQWAGDFEQAMNEVRRILRPGGMFLFSVPGPSSLQELHGLTKNGGGLQVPIYMPDLQDVGDLLVSTGFTEPVMDCEFITLNYPGAEQMNAELAVTGGAGFAEIQLPGMENEEVSVSFEVVYGLAFGPPEGQPVRTPEGETATFSVDQLRRQ